jgi:hypothetical protein
VSNLKLIEKYLAKLAQRLPRHKRQNVLEELRRNLTDYVAELTAQGIDEEEAQQQALDELGDPTTLAAEYGGGRVIIPATNYHIFKAAVITLMVAHLAATILATVLGVDVSLMILRAPNLQHMPVPHVIWTLATQALADIGIVTLFFWWLNITLPRHFSGRKIRIRVAEAKPHWAGLAGPLVMLGLVNFWRDDVLAFYTLSDGVWEHVPILNAQFVDNYLWPINVVLMLALAVHTVKLLSGPTATTAGVEFIYRLAMFALTGAMLSFKQPFVLPTEQTEVLYALLTGIFQVGLLAALFAHAFMLYRAGARLFDRITNQ